MDERDIVRTIDELMVRATRGIGYLNGHGGPSGGNLKDVATVYDEVLRALSTTQAELAEARKVIEPFARFSTHGFQGSVMEVCEPHPDNPSRRIEPFDAIHFRRASEFIRRVEGK